MKKLSEYSDLTPPSRITSPSSSRLKWPGSRRASLSTVSQKPKFAYGTPGSSGYSVKRAAASAGRIGHTHTGTMPISRNRKSRNSPARASGMSTSWITDSVKRPRSRASRRVSPQRAFQRITRV